MKHIFYAAVHITLKLRTRGLLLYGHAVGAILENCHSPLSEMSKISTITLIYCHSNMSILTLKKSKSIVNISISHI